MSTGRLSEVATMVDGTLSGPDASYVGVSTDTRTLKSGELYVALTGPNFDGHAFVGAARRLGAVGALVATAQDVELPQVVAGNTRRALARFAAAWRARFNIDVVGITGSNGKTSVKQMLAAIFAQRGETLATRGNLNNEIGVPLTLLRLRQRHRAAVIEMGASGPAEIGELAALAKPTVGIVNNAAAAHLEGFGTIEQVARTKGEMFSALPDDGVAIVNRDDEYYAFWLDLAKPRRVITFGEHEQADVTFRDFEQVMGDQDPRLHFTLSAFGESQRVTVPAAGRHNACNALAATAAGLACGLSLADCAAGLANADMAAGRLEVLSTPRGARVINDSYNANPDSMRAAIDFLADQDYPGWLVVGDMGELGDDAREMHAQVGKYARECGIARLYAIGELSRAASTAFGENGFWFDNIATLIDDLGQALPTDTNVLVKASRSMQLERVVQALCEAPQRAVGS